MSLKQESNEAEKTEIKPWRPDAWGERSEEFYEKAIIKGICQYCKAVVGEGRFAVCSCPGLVQARIEWKRKIYAEMTDKTWKSPEPKKIDYNPNKTIEPASFDDDEQF